jgi:type II secretory pathway component PulJ
MSNSPRSGTSLLEMLVALVLLELLAVGTMHAVLQTQRIARRVAAGGAVDVARLEAVRQAAAAPDCRDAAEPRVASINLPAAAQRPAMVVQVPCGR